MWLLTLVIGVSAANLSVRLEPQVIGLEDTASLVFDVSREDGVPVGQAQFEATDCQVLSEAQSESFQMSIINGVREAIRRTSVTFILSPRKQGRLQIHRIRIKVGQELLQANDLFLTVEEGVVAQGPTRSQGLKRFFGGQAARTSTGFLQLRAEASRQELFEGESSDVSYVLYHEYPLQHIEARSLPKFEGALKEELVSITQRRALPPPTQVLYQGRSVLKSELAKWRVTPLQVGTLEIEPLKVMTMSAAPPDPEDFFSSFLGGGGFQQKQLESPVLPLIVKALPKEESEQFSGVIGPLEVEVRFKKVSVKTGEPLPLEMTFRGQVARLRAPMLPPPLLDGVSRDWKSTAQLFEPRMSPVQGESRKVEWILIPRKKGILELGPFSVKTFDPETKAYKVMSLPVVKVQVDANGENEDQEAKVDAAETTASPSVTLLAPEERFASLAWVWASVLSILLACLGLAFRLKLSLQQYFRSRALLSQGKGHHLRLLTKEVEQFLKKKTWSESEGIQLIKKIRPSSSPSLRDAMDAILFDPEHPKKEAMEEVSRTWLKERGADISTRLS